MALIKKETRDKIVAQALNNMDFARRHKNGKINSWQLNEDMYYGVKEKTDDSRANVDLGQMQEHVHTLLSKIDSPLTFKYLKKKEAQLRRVQRLNALKDFDADRDYWDMKDIAGKKQSIIYGRAIYSYAASNDGGYKPHLENVDVYDFLVDPSAGGIDIDRARFLGRYGVIKDREELKKDKSYIQTEVKELLSGPGNADETSEEKNNKKNRTYANEHENSELENADVDKFVFWEWYETYGGQRYYLLLNENGCAIQVQKLTDRFASDMWPFWTFAAYPDLTEFWTPSPCDYVREIIMAQAVSINQMLDNAERVNKPQRAIDTGAIKNLAELKYRKDGYIRLNPGSNVASALKTVDTPSITTPIKVFETLETIKAAASGVTAGAKGVEDTDGRATIYEGNQANVADRFALFNKSYSFGYKRFADLYRYGVDENLTKKMSVDIIGPDGIEVQDIGRRDIFRKNEEFGVMVESSNAELLLSEQKKRGLGAFYSALLGRPEMANQKVVVEQLGKVAGETDENIRQLQDLENYGQKSVMSEAERDIERLLDGEIIQPNRIANAAYKQRLVNYMMDHEENMTPEQSGGMLQYIRSLDAVVVSNTQRAAREQAAKEQADLAAGGGAATGGRPQLRQPGPAQPLQDVIQQNV
jgi:hypothetical protein